MDGPVLTPNPGGGGARCRVRPRWIGGAVALVTLMAVACGDAFGPADVAGSYALTSANGTPVPAVVSIADGVTTRYEGGTLVLREDATWQGTLVISMTTAASTVSDTTTAAGAFDVHAPRLAPRSIHLTDAGDGEVLDGVVSGPEIVLVWDGVGLVFER